MSLGMGFEYRGYPPVPIITVIEPGGPAEAAGVQIGDIILQVEGTDVIPTRDVRDLLVNDNSEVRMVVQADNSLLSGGPWSLGFMNMTSLRGQPRTVTIKRNRSSGGTGVGGAAKAAHRSPNVDETPLPERAMLAREKGRTLFREGKWQEASEAFGEAIRECGTAHTLYTNRALCYQKLQRWSDVEQDARAARNCSNGGSSSVKAHYLLGKALLEQGKLEEAKEAMLKSMSLSSSPDFKSYRGSIEGALFFARKKMWERDQEAKDAAAEALRAELMGVAEACSSGEDKGEEAKLLAQRRFNAISQLLSRGRVKRNVEDIPNGITCKLTHRIMLDPVTTPFGQTYEREAIEKHLKEAAAAANRHVDSPGPDPFKASEKFSASQLTPNLALKRFIDEFLEQHPWAWDEDRR